MKKYVVSITTVALVFAACASDGGETEATEVPVTTQATTAPTTESPVSTDAPLAGPLTFKIAEGSKVSFEIGEVLNGNDETVLGTSREVSGEVTFDPSDPNGATNGTIVVQAATLTTDADRRNGAIRRFILDTDDFPEIVFKMTSISGADTGKATITGDLTVRDITIPVSFEMDVIETSPTRVVMQGSAVVTRDSLDLNIPSVPFVASVGQEVTLTATLVFES